MKNFRTEIQNSLDNNQIRFCFCLRIERLDGEVFRFTTFDEELEINRNWDGTQVNSQNAVTYYPDRSGIDDRKAITYESGTQSAVFDLTAALEPNGITRESIQSGKWDFSAVKLFKTLWDDPVEDDDPLMEGRFGSVNLDDNSFKTEIRSLNSLLEVNIGRTHEPLCQWDLGDANCKVDLASFEVSGTVGDVRDGGLTVEDSSLSGSKPDDFYGLGELRIDSGQNQGSARQIKEYDSSGIITLWQPFYFNLNVGESYRMVPGCRKRKGPDCRDKYNNVINHGGFADMPREDQTTKFGAPK